MARSPALKGGTSALEALVDAASGILAADSLSGTLGGFIQRRLGRIPSEGESVELDGIRLTVLVVEHRRVRQVRVERFDPDPQEAPDGEARPAPVASKF